MKTKDLNEFDGIKIGDLVRWKSGLLGAGRLQYVRNIWQDEDSITWLIWRIEKVNAIHPMCCLYGKLKKSN